MSNRLPRRGRLVRPARGLRLGAFEPVAEFVGRHVDEGVEFAVSIISSVFGGRGCFGKGESTR